MNRNNLLVLAVSYAVYCCPHQLFHVSVGAKIKHLSCVCDYAGMQQPFTHVSGGGHGLAGPHSSPVNMGNGNILQGKCDTQDWNCNNMT